MSETQVNIPLLRKAVEWAEAEAAKPFADSEWEQRFYVISADDAGENTPWGRIRLQKSPECGTCYCIAGWTAQQESPQSPMYDSRDIATAALGLNIGQADALFHASNTIENVRRIAENIAGERL